MQHFASLEVLRIVAATSVIARHLGPEMRELLPGGLAATVFLSFVFAFDAGSREPMGSLIASRARRLLLPWLFWCAVYALRDFATSFPENPKFVERASATQLLIGPTIHLWYLPFVFVFGLVAAALGRKSWFRWPWLWLLLLAPMCWAHVALDGGVFPRPFQQWTNALPGIALAGALASLDPRDPRGRRLIAFAAFIAVAVFVPMHLAGEHLAYFLMFALPLATIAWSVRAPASRTLVTAGKLTYGVYLIHPLVIWELTRWIPRDSLLALIAVATVSFGLVAILVKTPLRRFV